MPTFSNVTAQVDVEIDVDFEVFCAGCGAGICNNANTRKSHGRNYNQVTVEPCEKCLQSARDEAESATTNKYESEIDELKSRIAELQKESAQ